MYQFSEEITIISKPEKIFAIYKDVANWNKWDSDTKTSEITGPFSVGSVIKLKPTKGPKTNIEIVSVEKDKSFTVRSRFPFCLMAFEHLLTYENNATLVVHRITFTGPLSFLFCRLVGGQIKKGMPETLRSLKQKVEN